MKPTRSTNRTETSRRSATGGGATGAATGAAGWPSGVPHSPQNRWPGGFEAPQDAHPAASALPQLPQNFWPAGFSVPQVEQANTPRSLSGSAGLR